MRPAALTFNVSWSGVVDCFSVTNQIDGNRYCGRYAQISTASIDWSASEAHLSFASAPGSSVSAFAAAGQERNNLFSG